MRAARAGTASVIISAEGADFLEGRIDRLDEAYAKWSLRHLQLTHYRVNELGDIQTEPPVHGGLTDFGAEVIRRCNRLGIVVDVAHGTYDLVVRAASVTSKPLVLSHTSLASTPARYSRRVSPEHARVVAKTGGVVGVWPPAGEFPSLPAMAAGMARMADAVGIDHVALGSDMTGLIGPSVLPDYDQLPGLAEALIGVGLSVADTAKGTGRQLPTGVRGVHGVRPVQCDRPLGKPDACLHSRSAVGRCRAAAEAAPNRCSIRQVPDQRSSSSARLTWVNRRPRTNKAAMRDPAPCNEDRYIIGPYRGLLIDNLKRSGWTRAV